MAVYLLVFTLFAAFLLGYFFWNAQRLLGLQINSTIDTEISSLAEQYGQGGLLVHAARAPVVGGAHRRAGGRGRRLRPRARPAPPRRHQRDEPIDHRGR